MIGGRSDVQHRLIRRGGGTHESELTPGHRQRGEIVPCHGDGTGEGLPGRLHVTKDQRRLCFGRIEPIVVGLTTRALRVTRATRLLGQLASPLEIAG